MAPSPFHPKASRHARSISLPSRSHPLTLQVEEQLHRLKALEATSSSSTTSYNFEGLKNLHDNVNNFLLLPQMQQALAQERGEKWVDEMLDGSLRMLDVCSTARDVLSQIKECVRELQSSIRRIRGESGLVNEVEAYNASRKKVTEVIRKCLGDLRKAEKQCQFSSLLDKSQSIVAMAGVLREVEAITLSIFESLLSSLSGSKAMTRPNGWSWLSKFMNNKQGTCDRKMMERCGLEVDVILGTVSQRIHKGLEFWHFEVQKQLETMESSIQDLENGNECTFHSLIETRVTLLNILNQ